MNRARTGKCITVLARLSAAAARVACETAESRHETKQKKPVFETGKYTENNAIRLVGDLHAASAAVTLRGKINCVIHSLQLSDRSGFCIT